MRRRGSLRAATASVAIALALAILALTTLVFDQRLHGAVHDAAQSPEHSCALTIFAGGQVDAAGPPVIDVARLSGGGDTLPVGEYQTPAAPAGKRARARAPPAGASQ